MGVMSYQGIKKWRRLRTERKEYQTELLRKEQLAIAEAEKKREARRERRELILHLI